MTMPLDSNTRHHLRGCFGAIPYTVGKVAVCTCVCLCARALKRNISGLVSEAGRRGKEGKSAGNWRVELTTATSLSPVSLSSAKTFRCRKTSGAPEERRITRPEQGATRRRCRVRDAS